MVMSLRSKRADPPEHVMNLVEATLEAHLGAAQAIEQFDRDF
jgi:hypothetical protein